MDKFRITFKVNGEDRVWEGLAENAAAAEDAVYDEYPCEAISDMKIDLA